MRRFACGLVAAGAIGVIATPTRAGIRISIITDGVKPVAETSDIQCIRFAGSRPEARVWQEMPVFPFDELRSVKDDLHVELTDSLTTIRLSGPFRAIVWGVQGGSLVVQLLSGQVEVETDQPTQLQAGLVVLGTRSTAYGVGLRAAPAGAECTAAVYDGEVTFSAGVQQRVAARGSQVTVPGSGDWTVATIPDEDLVELARRQSAVAGATAIAAGIAADVVKAGREDLAAARLAVLRDPADAQAREQLGVRLVTMRTPRAALYQLTRAEPLIPRSEVNRRGAIVAAQSEAYLQLGMDAQARQVLARGEAELPRGSIPPRLEGGGSLTIEARRPEVVSRDQAALFELLRRGEHRAAAQGFQERIGTRAADSRDHFGLARAQAGLDQKRAASVSAARALELDARDHKLAPKERDEAARMSRSVSPTVRQCVAGELKSREP